MEKIHAQKRQHSGRAMIVGVGVGAGESVGISAGRRGAGTGRWAGASQGDPRPLSGQNSPCQEPEVADWSH